MQNYQVLQAFDGQDGLYIARHEKIDLIVLDIMMPYKSGFELLHDLRLDGNDVPVIILSARTQTADKIKGLKLGADDYMEKPFSFEELLARIERKIKIQPLKDFVFGSYTYVFDTSTLLKSNKVINLTLKEIKLLEFFIKRRLQIVSREQIISQVWHEDYDGTDRTVDNLILNLRKKLGKDYIVTVHGAGYRFVCDKSMTTT